MKTPGPEHPITIEPATSRWRARFAGHVIADSNEAMILRAAAGPPRVYFPRQDVELGYMSRTERTTYCPYKGDASYFTILMDGEFADNSVWSYERPFPAMEAITGRLSFYPDKVEVYPVDDAAVNPEHRYAADEPGRTGVDQVVQHTDAGDGTSQLEHWRPNVETPDGGVR